jgi:hypothetical protein
MGATGRHGQAAGGPVGQAVRASTRPESSRAQQRYRLRCQYAVRTAAELHQFQPRRQVRQAPCRHERRSAWHGGSARGPQAEFSRAIAFRACGRDAVAAARTSRARKGGLRTRRGWSPGGPIARPATMGRTAPVRITRARRARSRTRQCRSARTGLQDRPTNSPGRRQALRGNCARRLRRCRRCCSW